MYLFVSRQILKVCERFGALRTLELLFCGQQRYHLRLRNVLVQRQTWSLVVNVPYVMVSIIRGVMASYTFILWNFHSYFLYTRVFFKYFQLNLYILLGTSSYFEEFIFYDQNYHVNYHKSRMISRMISNIWSCITFFQR